MSKNKKDNLKYLEEESKYDPNFRVDEFKKSDRELWEEDKKYNWLKKTGRRVLRYGKKYRPDKQTFDFEEGGKLSYKIKPKFGEIGKAIKGDDHDIMGETKVELKYEGKIEDVDFYVSIKGKPYKICRDGLHSDDSFETKIGFTKKF